MLKTFNLVRTKIYYFHNNSFIIIFLNAYNANNGDVELTI